MMNPALLASHQGCQGATAGYGDTLASLTVLALPELVRGCASQHSLLTSSVTSLTFPSILREELHLPSAPPTFPKLPQVGRVVFGLLSEGLGEPWAGSPVLYLYPSMSKNLSDGLGCVFVSASAGLLCPVSFPYPETSLLQVSMFVKCLGQLFY